MPPPVRRQHSRGAGRREAPGPQTTPRRLAVSSSSATFLPPPSTPLCFRFATVHTCVPSAAEQPRTSSLCLRKFKGLSPTQAPWQIPLQQLLTPVSLWELQHCREAKREFYSIVEGHHELYEGVSEPYKHTIRYVVRTPEALCERPCAEAYSDPAEIPFRFFERRCLPFFLRGAAELWPNPAEAPFRFLL